MEGQLSLLITGVTGFLGSWIAKVALESKLYKVHGSVVDKDDQDTHAYLKEGLGELKEDLKLVEVNLASEEEVKRACEGMHYVIHCSSPDSSEKSKRKSAPEPAVHAALNILNA